jgi:FMN phosphatase YigB (HAD superfamily)
LALDTGRAQYLIFDLDDTLFDTFGLLVQPAVAEACEAMIHEGLRSTLTESKARYFREFILDPRQNIYERLVKIFGVKEGVDPSHVAAVGAQAFYYRKIKERLETFEGVHETLEALNGIFKLALVTIGSPETQKKKMQLLKIEKFFDEISYVNIANEKSKKTAFEKIMASVPRLEPGAFVSIGNRIDGEIRNGKELGMQTVLMLHGEYLYLEPRDQFEVPDSQIKKIPELLDIFRSRLQR